MSRLGDRLATAVAIVVILLALLCFAYQLAAAHEAPSGWAYSDRCCSSRDCAPVPTEAVREAPGGYTVLIQPHEHPMLRGAEVPARAFFPHGDDRIQPSGDQQRHACVGRGGTVFCVYLPASGF